MKYPKEKALDVIRVFERHLKININIKNYTTKDFYHVFDISPIIVDGKDKTQIHFKDSLIDECMSMQGNIPDVEDFVKICFL